MSIKCLILSCFCINNACFFDVLLGRKQLLRCPGWEKSRSLLQLHKYLLHFQSRLYFVFCFNIASFFRVCSATLVASFVPHVLVAVLLEHVVCLCWKMLKFTSRSLFAGTSTASLRSAAIILRYEAGFLLLVPPTNYAVLNAIRRYIFKGHSGFVYLCIMTRL